MCQGFAIPKEDINICYEARIMAIAAASIRATPLLTLPAFDRGDPLWTLPRLDRGGPLWTLLGSNQRPSDYESDALTG